MFSKASYTNMMQKFRTKARRQDHVGDAQTRSETPPTTTTNAEGGAGDAKEQQARSHDQHRSHQPGHGQPRQCHGTADLYEPKGQVEKPPSPPPSSTPSPEKPPESTSGARLTAPLSPLSLPVSPITCATGQESVHSGAVTPNVPILDLATDSLTVTKTGGWQDHVIDIWSDCDPLDYPLDVQAYLECVARYSEAKPNGFYLAKELRKQGLDPNDLSASYVPDVDAMVRGRQILIAEYDNVVTDGVPKNLFFPPRHVFEPAALAEYPLHPWRYGLDACQLAEILNATRPWDPQNDWKDPMNRQQEYLYLGTARISIPETVKARCSPRFWAAAVGAACGYQHPISFVSGHSRWDDSSIDERRAYHILGVMGVPIAPWPPESPCFSDEDSE